MKDEQAMELAKWMAQVADRYNQSIARVVDTFNQAIKKHEDCNMAKLEVVKEMSQIAWRG